MVDTLAKQGANAAGLVATISGGASMFGAGGPIQIGIKNVKAVTEMVTQLRIPIVGEHLAGAKGRRITFDSETGKVSVDMVGESTIIL